MRLLIPLVVAAGLLPAQAPEKDSRNVNIPNTDTHFQAPQYDSLASWEMRKTALRYQIMFAAGLDPLPEKTPLHAQEFGRIEREGYSIEKVLLETLPGFYLGGNLYRPEGDGPFPAIVKPHGHWTYGRLENQPLNSTQTLAANFAKMGFVVFAYDMVGYNDTAQLKHRVTNRREQLWGFGPLGLQLWDSIRVVDYLAAKPYVDRSRIAATGASGGATQVFLLTAVDDRIAVSAPVNMVSAIMQGGCVCENAPGLRVNTFNVEFARMMAPRPMLLVAATGDWTKNVPREEYPAVKQVYQLYGKPELVETVQFDSPHNYHQDSRTAVYRFFAKHLLGRKDAASIKEEKTRIESLQDMLALYGRAPPENAVDRAGLFEWWRRQASRQAMAANDDEARERLRLALKVEWPAKVRHDAHGNSIVVYRPGEGDRVPGLWFAGREKPVLIVHPDGAQAARQTAVARSAIEAGRSVLLIDAFQTGPAKAPRDRSHTHFLTFNLTDDANRVQDILTAASFLSALGQGRVEVVGLDRAAVWTVFAAALAPVELRLEADLDGFEDRDQDYLDGFFVPGIRRAGGLAAAKRLTATMRGR